MGYVPIVIIALVGVTITILSAARIWRASKAGAPREQVIGYMAIMVAAAAITMLLLRVL